LNELNKNKILWIDLPDAEEILEIRRKKEPTIDRNYSQLHFFIKNGYVILEGAVSGSKIDTYLEDFENALSVETDLLASVLKIGPEDKSIIPAHLATKRAPLTKYLDTYWIIPSALPLVFNRRTQEFLSIIFSDLPYAFQGLHFETGSTQAIHQDTAYVVCEYPKSLAASWCALEDVKAGSGELIYYEGSHRLPDWFYSKKYKHFNHERDDHQEHLDHLAFLKTESDRRGYPLKRFLPKKGDVLIWAADLAHGGAEIKNTSLTRKSLVTHFCPSSIKPHYLQYLPAARQVTRDYGDLGKASTFYYELENARQLDLKHTSKTFARSIVKALRRMLR
jgi:phytanoyl-CoA hydroxylase